MRDPFLQSSWAASEWEGRSGERGEVMNVGVRQGGAYAACILGSKSVKLRREE